MEPNLPWMANLTVPEGGLEASTPLPSGRHANIGAFVSHTETETKDMKIQVATHSTQLVATQSAVQDFANMLKPVLTQLSSEVHDIKVGHTQAGLLVLRHEHEQMRAALTAQGFHLPPAGSAAAAAAPLPALPDADMTATRGAGSLPAGGASATSAAQPGGWRQVLANAAPPEAAASVAGATAGVPLGQGNAHDQQAAAGATCQLPRPNTEGAPPCDDDELGALWASGLPLTGSGPPKLCRNADICGLQTLDQSLLGDFCCGACAHTYGSEHDERKSQIKYSDKKRVARFREYADVLYEKRGMDEALDALIGDIVLDDELSQISKCDRDGEESRGWAEVHWRPPHARAATAAEADGRRAEDEEGGSVRRAGGHDERLESGERA